MPRAKTNKIYRTFVKGLVTEAGPLTFPENASIDELNTVVSRKGNRTRRQGIRFEEDFVLNNIGELPDYSAFSEFLWHSVNNEPSRALMVVQCGGYIHFWDVDDTPLSDKKKEFVLTMPTFKSPEADLSDVIGTPASFAAGAGFLYVAHPFCEPVVVAYDPDKDEFNASPVLIQIRDFEGTYDGLANDEEPAVLSDEHNYNLLNQGWGPPGTTPAGSGNGGTYYDPYRGGSYPYIGGSGRGGGGGIREINTNIDLV